MCDERCAKEGYQDSPTRDILENSCGKKRKAERKAAFRPLVFVCSPYAGNVSRNVERARKYARFAMEQKTLPVCMHLMLPQYMDDSAPAEREIALFMNMVILGKCDELWVFGDVISSGMEQEINRAKRRNKIIRYFTEDCTEVSPQMIGGTAND